MARKSHKDNLVLPDVARYFLIAAVLIVLVLLFWVISPFFTLVVYAALIAVIFDPVYKFLLRIFARRQSFSAALCTFLVFLIFLIPLTFFVLFVAQEAVDTYKLIEEKALTVDFSSLNLTQFETIPVIGTYLESFDQKYNIARFVSNLNIDIVGTVKDAVQVVSTFLVNQSANFVLGLGNSFISLILMLITIFYFFRDGDKIRDYIKNISPLPTKYENEIEKKLKNTIFAIAVGGFGSSIIQGVVGAIGLQIVGVKYIAFLGTMIAFASIIPYVGSSVIWLPICIALLISGQTYNALFLFIWGFVLISTVDNFVKPLLIGTRANMHPLATFFVVMGGLFVFGLKGIIFGPLILALALTIFHIYRLEYKDVLKN